MRNASGAIVWNLIGNTAPTIAALFAIPYLTQTLGIERFGLLSLAWVTIGYFGILDLGIGRVLTKLVSERISTPEQNEIPSLCATGLYAMAAVGLLGTAVTVSFYFIEPTFIYEIPRNLQTETGNSLVWIAIGIPIVVVTAGLRGIIEGFQDFKSLNLVRIPIGALFFLSPCVTTAWSPSLDLAIAAVVFSRLLGLAAHIRVCERSLQRIQGPRIAAPQYKWLREMLQFGGWLTVSNLVGPVIVYVDRFLIGLKFSAEAIAYYAAPFEAVSRLLVVPWSLTAVLFPNLSIALRQNPRAAYQLAKDATLLLCYMIFPLTLFGVILSSEILNFWLGPQFAEKSSVVTQVLLIGFAFNSLAQIPFTTLHGMGQTRSTAILHLCELPLYLAALSFALNEWGINGAAWMWMFRAAFDMIALYVMCLYSLNAVRLKLRLPIR